MVEITAPAGLPLLAPAATWAGVTRMDEPVGEDDPSPHHGTVFRLVARDTEIARRIAVHLPEGARVIAGEHSYGRQLDEQLTLVGLRRNDGAGVVLLAGLTWGPEIARAAATAPLPLIAFDGVQGADLGAGLLSALREQFDPHGDPIDPPVWLYTAGPDWTLSPDRPI